MEAVLSRFRPIEEIRRDLQKPDTLGKFLVAVDNVCHEQDIVDAMRDYTMCLEMGEDVTGHWFESHVLIQALLYGESPHIEDYIEDYVD